MEFIISFPVAVIGGLIVGIFALVSVSVPRRSRWSILKNARFYVLSRYSNKSSSYFTDNCLKRRVYLPRHTI